MHLAVLALVLASAAVAWWVVRARHDAHAVGALREAIRAKHACDARWLESVHVRETRRGAIVWEGDVQAFELVDHPQAARAYAWSHDGEGVDRHVHVVLGVAPIATAVDAVRAVLRVEHA